MGTLLGVNVMKFLCLIVGHRRSRGKARLNARTAQYESECSYCQSPMVRLAHRQWIVGDEGQTLKLS